MAQPITEEELQDLYHWIDAIELSRPKRNISRDFSDGVMAAEVIANFIPRIVELHNYQSASSTHAKRYNWETLQRKVLRRLHVRLPNDQITDIVNAVPGSIEPVLLDIRDAIEYYMANKASRSMSSRDDDQPEPREIPLSQAMAPIKPRRQQREPEPDYAEQETMEIMQEQEQRIGDLEEANKVLEIKVEKLQQLVKLKDSRIRALTDKLIESGLV
ncbi:sperm flagellar protein [Carpediemonas membranifera]|uniref:Sperm flagellar protein n=1 Tax=Carpediemonas membranifera TaxID=201153 RepID=A0A8J6B5V4_9EUKA|nr:sperm flagellar protein [Carpediemonas membranifera]|eukprot:KAG9394909.1 sperm flagellar protein [Carpediemonas membranifera]